MQLQLLQADVPCARTSGRVQQVGPARLSSALRSMPCAPDATPSANTPGAAMQAHGLPCLAARPWQCAGLRGRRRAGLRCPVLASAGRGPPRSAAHAAFGEPSSDSEGERAGSRVAGRRQQQGQQGQGQGQQQKGGLSRVLISAGVVGGLLALAGAGVLMKDQIRGFLVS